MAQTEVTTAAPAAYETPRLGVRDPAEDPAPFPDLGGELPPVVYDAEAPDNPLTAYIQAFHNEIPGADAQPEEQEEAPGFTPEGPYPGAIEAAPEPVPAEIVNEQDATRIAALAALTPEEIHAMTEQERAVLREHFVDALERATTVEARVRLVARYMDIYMLKPAIATAFPVIGDVGMAVGNGIYQLWEAHNTDLTTWDMAKIIAYQTVDAAVGAIPVVGDAADLIFPANVLGAQLFKEQVERLAVNARAAGVPEATIQQLLDDADLFVERWDVLYQIYAAFKGKEVPPPNDKPQMPPAAEYIN